MQQWDSQYHEGAILNLPLMKQSIHFSFHMFFNAHQPVQKGSNHKTRLEL